MGAKLSLSNKRTNNYENVCDIEVVSLIAWMELGPEYADLMIDEYPYCHRYLLQKLQVFLED